MYMDGAGVTTLPDGGYVYVSNSEDDSGRGGVYGLYFNKDGEITNYKALLSGTTWNCGGKGLNLRHNLSVCVMLYLSCLIRSSTIHFLSHHTCKAG